MILAVDPGLANFGWALVSPSDARVRELGVLRSGRNAGAARSDDRRERAHAIAVALLEHAGIDTVIGESMSFPRGIDGIASMALSWGVLCGVAAARGAQIREVPPKTWQRAVLPGSGKRVDYAQIEAALDAHVRRHGAPAAIAQLDALPRSCRTHALDAAGVGIWAAVTSSQEKTMHHSEGV